MKKFDLTKLPEKLCVQWCMEFCMWRHDNYMEVDSPYLERGGDYYVRNGRLQWHSHTTTLPGYKRITFEEFLEFITVESEPDTIVWGEERMVWNEGRAKIKAICLHHDGEHIHAVAPSQESYFRDVNVYYKTCRYKYSEPISDTYMLNGKEVTEKEMREYLSF